MHISQDEKEAFRTDNMPLQNTISFLEHLEQCPYCMEQFLQNQAAEETPAPAYLRQQILEKSVSPGIRMKRTAYHVSQRMQIALCIVPAFCHGTYRYGYSVSKTDTKTAAFQQHFQTA